MSLGIKLLLQLKLLIGSPGVSTIFTFSKLCIYAPNNPIISFNYRSNLLPEDIVISAQNYFKFLKSCGKCACLVLHKNNSYTNLVIFFREIGYMQYTSLFKSCIFLVLNVSLMYSFDEILSFELMPLTIYVNMYTTLTILLTTLS